MARLAIEDGEYRPCEDLSVGIGTHALHYGINVFEGVRVSWDPVFDGLSLCRRRGGVRR